MIPSIISPRKYSVVLNLQIVYQQIPPTQVTYKPLRGVQVKHWLSHFDVMPGLSQRYLSHFYMKTGIRCFERKHVVSWKQIFFYARSAPWLLHTWLCRHDVLSGNTYFFADPGAPDHHEILDDSKRYPLVTAVPVCWKCGMTSGQHQCVNTKLESPSKPESQTRSPAALQFND